MKENTNDDNNKYPKHGFAPTSRDMMYDDSDLYFEERFTKLSAYNDLERLANYKTNTVNIRGTTFEAYRGQTLRSIQSLAERWKWCESSVRSFLDEYQERGYLIYENESNRSTRITLLKYPANQEESAVNRTVNRNHDSAMNRNHPENESGDGKNIDSGDFESADAVNRTVNRNSDSAQGDNKEDNKGRKEGDEKIKNGEAALPAFNDFPVKETNESNGTASLEMDVNQEAERLEKELHGTASAQSVTGTCEYTDVSKVTSLFDQFLVDFNDFHEQKYRTKYKAEKPDSKYQGDAITVKEAFDYFFSESENNINTCKDMYMAVFKFAFTDKEEYKTKYSIVTQFQKKHNIFWLNRLKEQFLAAVNEILDKRHGLSGNNKNRLLGEQKSAERLAQIRADSERSKQEYENKLKGINN